MRCLKTVQMSTSSNPSLSVKPKIVIAPEDVTTERGVSVTFICAAEGNPTPSGTTPHLPGCMAGYSPGFGDECTRPRYPAPRKSFHARDFKHGRIFAGKSLGKLGCYLPGSMAGYFCGDTREYEKSPREFVWMLMISQIKGCLRWCEYIYG